MNAFVLLGILCQKILKELVIEGYWYAQFMELLLVLVSFPLNISLIPPVLLKFT